MATEPGDERGAVRRGHLRASDVDREQVIATLKTAFVQGRLAKDEFDLRIGQALASRTCAELAALTTDLPAGLTAAQPPPPARTPGEPRIPRPGLVLTVSTVVYAAAWLVAVALPRNSEGEPEGAALIVTASLFYLLLLLMIGTPVLADRLNERFAGQLPRRPRGLPARQGPAITHTP